jgi:hypothetical protein
VLDGDTLASVDARSGVARFSCALVSTWLPTLLVSNLISADLSSMGNGGGGGGIGDNTSGASLLGAATRSTVLALLACSEMGTTDGAEARRDTWAIFRLLDLPYSEELDCEETTELVSGS